VDVLLPNERERARSRVQRMPRAAEILRAGPLGCHEAGKTRGDCEAGEGGVQSRNRFSSRQWNGWRGGQFDCGICSPIHTRGRDRRVPTIREFNGALSVTRPAGPRRSGTAEHRQTFLHKASEASESERSTRRRNLLAIVRTEVRSEFLRMAEQSEIPAEKGSRTCFWRKCCCGEE